MVTIKRQTKSVGMDVEKKGPLCIVFRKVNWYSHNGKHYRGASQSYKIELPYYLAILLLGYIV